MLSNKVSSPPRSPPHASRHPPYGCVLLAAPFHLCRYSSATAIGIRCQARDHPRGGRLWHAAVCARDPEDGAEEDGGWEGEG